MIVQAVSQEKNGRGGEKEDFITTYVEIKGYPMCG